MTGFAQEVSTTTISGTVVSIVDNQPMEGVYLRVDGVAGVFRETDAEGRFSIPAPSTEVSLVFMYPGFFELTQFVGTPAELYIKLIPTGTNSNLSEVLVNNGVRRQQRFTTQAVTTLTEESFADRSYSTLEGYLYGKVPGVTVTTVDGMLGSPSSINIRGISSITTGSQPLYIIDGMEISNVSHLSDWGSESLNTNLYSNPLMALNVKDIESVTIKKDALSKALYGSRGANGVVYIETIKGERGASQIDLMVNQGLQFRSFDQMDLLNAEEHRQYMYEMALNQHKTPENVLGVYGDYLFNDPQSRFFHDYNNSTLWRRRVQENAAYYGDYHLRIRGGDNVAKYVFSVGMMDQSGILKNTNLNKMNARFNLDYQVQEWMVIGTNLYFCRLEQERHPMGLSAYNPLLVAHQKSPITGAYAKDANGNHTLLYQDSDFFGISNPMSLTHSTSNEFKNNIMGGKLYASFYAPNNYSATIYVGLHNQTLQDRLFLPRHGIVPRGDAFRTSQLYAENDLLIDMRLDLNYENVFDNIHYVRAGVGANYLYDQIDYTFGSAINSGGDDYTRLNQGALNDASMSGDEEWKMIAGYMHGNYVLKGKYIADVVMRVDASSRFGQDNRAAFYPAFGVAWRAGQEEFLRNVQILDELKVRANIGFSGSDNFGNYTSRLLFTPSNYKYLGGVMLSRLSNKELAPERLFEINMGLDASVFNQRLNLSVDYYDRTNQNMILPVMYTLEQGIYAMVNTGKMTNKGVEFGLKGYLRTGEINWSLGATLAYNINQVTELHNSIERLEQTYDIFTAVASVGQPVGSFYGYQTNGVYASDADVGALQNGRGFGFDSFRGGDVRFVDNNNDGYIDEEDMTYLGKALPDMVAGVNLAVSWKGITLSGLIDTQMGREVVNGMRYKLESMQDYSNQSVTVMDRWRRQGDVTDMPRISHNDPTGNNRFSDRWVEDGSFVRLRNVSLSYELPTDIVQRVRANRISVFVSAENVLTWTKYSGFDPEFNHMYSDFLSGLDLASMYIPRTLTVGLRVGL